MVAPAEKRRARASDARARSSATRPASLIAVWLATMLTAPVSHRDFGSDPKIPPEIRWLDVGYI